MEIRSGERASAAPLTSQSPLSSRSGVGALHGALHRDGEVKIELAGAIVRSHPSSRYFFPGSPDHEEGGSSASAPEALRAQIH